MVPSSSWYANVRSLVSTANWKKIRLECFKEHGRVCIFCNKTGYKGRIDCHEIWDYDDANGTQALKDIIPLCPSCHSVCHIGRTTLMGGYDKAMTHFVKVRGITMAAALSELKAAYALFDTRSKKSWTLVLPESIQALVKREGG